MKEERNINFVARHYRDDAFDVKTGWRHTGISRNRRGRLRIAATVAAVIALGATATYMLNDGVPAGEETDAPLPYPTAGADEKISRAVEFEDAALPDVARRIGEVYGVKVTNLPADADSLRLTLRYEGTAGDLIATVNELLGTEMEVR